MKLYKAFCLLSIACINAVALPSQAAIYKLDDHVNRVTIYSNMPILPAPVRKDVPKPLAPTSTPTPTPRAKEADAPLAPPQAPSPSIGVKPVGSALTDYPRISPAVQKTRDGERLSILIHELQTEEEALNAALSRNAATDIIHRYKTNIEALKREVEKSK